MSGDRRRRDRGLQTAVSRLVRLLFRRIEVHGSERLPAEGPVLTVANHFGGLLDILLLIAVMRRYPRIIARDVIWRIPVVGQIATWAGAIPVSKPEDRGNVDNDAMFAATHQALRDESHVLIFPEGITRDDPSIGRVKSGAARIVLGARADGVAGINILPVGIHYEDKAALRSAVSVYVGEPLSLDSEIGSYVGPDEAADTSNREAVKTLTKDIDGRLRQAAPDFKDWEEAEALTFAAEVLLRQRTDGSNEAVSISARDRLAGLAGSGSALQRERVKAEVHEYQQSLEKLGLGDDSLAPDAASRRSLRVLLGNVVLALLLLPFALVGALINAVPFLIVKAVGLIRAAPAVLATLKPAAAVAGFGLAWALVGWWASSNYGVAAGLAALVLMPVYLATVIVFVDRISVIWRTVRHWIRGTDSLEIARKAALINRSAVIDAFKQAL